jgi:hypothetical protein
METVYMIRTIQINKNIAVLLILWVGVVLFSFSCSSQNANSSRIIAHIEFMVPKGSNSGVYFMGRYEIQVLDSWGKEEVIHSDAGGIYERWDENREPKGYEGVRPRKNASRKPGEWQEFDVIFQAPRFDSDGKKIANATFIKVIHNGIVIHENVEVTGPTRAAMNEYDPEQSKGPLMLQGDHGPVAYRNIWITRN